MYPILLFRLGEMEQLETPVSLPLVQTRLNFGMQVLATLQLNQLQ
jgi:hypothetical protein